MAGMLLRAAGDQHDDWLCEAEEVRFAYERWCAAPVAERPVAYVAYRAALEREERAGALYAELIGPLRGASAAGPGSGPLRGA